MRIAIESTRSLLLLTMAVGWVVGGPGPTGIQGEATAGLTPIAASSEDSAAPHPAAGDSLAAALAEAGPAAVVAIHHGVDVSRHSGAVDWQVIADQGFTFAVVKATEGVDLEDSAFQGHWPAIRKVGLRRGAYHFYVTEDDPVEQAEFFLRTVPFSSGDLVPVVDVELIGHNTPPGLAERLRTFLDHIEKRVGVKPMIYTSPHFWNRHLTADFGDYPLWIAEYDVAAPVLPKGWEQWHLWQSKGDATVEGVAKGADLNLGNPRLDAIASLLIP
ncbi:MAG: GH25 family lysozyme [Acidobacteriota bacterium]